MKGSLEKFLSGLNKENLEKIVGYGSGDALRRAFPQAKLVHPRLTAETVSREQWQPRWNGMMKERTGVVRRLAYIHVPFCRGRCYYCGFFQNLCDDGAETRYVCKLLDELRMSASPRLEAAALQAVYIGGGSPSSLSPRNCARLMDGIRKYLPLANDCEITYESRINDMTEERVEALFAGGVNRISLGVQTFDTKLRRSVGRIDTQEEVLETLDRLCGFGQAPIVIDLIYGFPGQTMEMWRNDLRLLKESRLDGFDLYHLKLYPGSALQKAIDSGALPPAATMAEKAEMFAEAEKALARYSRLSVCHWADNHRERSLYNSLSKSGAEIVPFGCGAGGNIGGFSLFLQRDVEAYSKQIDDGLKPIMFMGAQNSLNGLAGAVAGQVDAGYVDPERLAADFGGEAGEIRGLLAVWEKNGLIRREGDVFLLEQAGRFWNVNIAQSLIECFSAIRGEKISGAARPLSLDATGGHPAGIPRHR